LIVLFATVALLMISAVPVSAAPGGVPGPPPGHDKAKDDVPEVDDADPAVKELPEWAKAYGKRIKDAYGIPFGHLQQCAGLADDEPAAEDATADDDKVKKALEACPEDLEFPEDENGAKAFWVFTEIGLVIVGT
jgi:hypothetical protein